LHVRKSLCGKAWRNGRGLGQGLHAKKRKEERELGGSKDKGRERRKEELVPSLLGRNRRP